MNYKNFIQTKVSQKTLWVIGALVVALLIFQAGVFVGYHKASFSYGSGDNFHRIFGAPEPRRMMRGGMMNFPGDEFTSAYGTMGTIVKIALPTIIVAGTDKIEKTIVVNEQTIIRHFRDDIRNKDLKIGDTIIVIGSPNASSAEIEAKLIRVLPAFPGSAVTTNK